MSDFAGLFSKRTKKIGGIFIDGFVREVHKNTVEVTQFPIESGANINDHRIINPISIEVEGIISNSTSLSQIPLILPNFITGANSSRATQVYTELQQLLTSGEPISVVTGLITYRNMVITSLEVDRDRVKSSDLWFNAKLQEVLIVQSESSVLNPEQFKQGKTRNQASPLADSGRQPAPLSTTSTITRNINYVKSLRV